MPYDTSIDVAYILRSTLYLLEHTRYPQKESQAIQAAILQLRQSLADLEAAAKPPAANEDDTENAELA